MNNAIFLILFAGHIIGDFYFQTETIAEKKASRPTWLLLHCALYTLALLLVSIPVWSTPMVFAVTIAAASHFVINLAKTLLIRQKEKHTWIPQHTGWIYAIDQILHILSLIVIAIVYTAQNGVPTALPFLMNIQAFDFALCLKATLLALLVAKPINITFAKLFGRFKPVEQTVDKNKKAGSMIGTLERLIIVTLLCLQQYAAMGFIVAAKSIVRYNKISEDKAFGEYYLIGTLFSVLAAIVAFIIVW